MNECPSGFRQRAPIAKYPDGMIVATWSETIRLNAQTRCPCTSRMRSRRKRKRSGMWRQRRRCGSIFRLQARLPTAVELGIGRHGDLEVFEDLLRVMRFHLPDLERMVCLARDQAAHMGRTQVPANGLDQLIARNACGMPEKRSGCVQIVQTLDQAARQQPPRVEDRVLEGGAMLTDYLGNDVLRQGSRAQGDIGRGLDLCRNAAACQ
mmetsp:Transcript_48942/g.148981  ORF Transcript_48942/g.148981 Transcript_48942/m.148981 type:complete len:208 (-) Transcript_48942:160-783(-)